MRYANPSKKSRSHASLKGYSVNFPGKGTVKKEDAPNGASVSEDGLVFVFVPAQIEDEVAAIGMLPESERDPDAGNAENKAPKRPETAEKLEEELFAAFALVKERNNREDFAGNGTPRVPVVEKIVGYDLGVNDIKAAWPKFLASLKD